MTRSLHDLLATHRLTPAQRRIASYLAAHPTVAAALSSTELARYAGVSQPSVTRFVALLGFDGYAEFRRYLRDSAADAPATGNKFQAGVDADIRRLNALREQLADDARLLRLGASLVESDPLVVLGNRVSAAQAASFGYLAAKIHPDVRVLTDAGSVLGDHLRHAHRCGARVVVVFALPRYPRESRDSLVQAKELGLRSVLITDKPVSLLTPDADEVLSAGVGSEFVFDSHAAVTSLTVALVEAMADAAGAAAQKRLEAFEDYAARQELFLPD
ncbi:MurR/RpiR family transcriptional regulator [Saccharopolyspora rosea]|uniref:MurR/RpiR family transcriptional regulator n=1 Tax=Saccharopolyspora rosea TaxID=524884 RepID=A0ABW3FSD9_9PSEU|nr:MurR/RpiR family transcriptional regulator [Saccharopolyspora rosea]